MKTKTTKPLHALAFLATALALLSTLNAELSTCLAAPLGTAFTYQGRLNDSGAPASGIYDLRFAIYDLDGGGSQVGPSLTNTATAVANGLFTVPLDFGAVAFDGDARWLQIGVRTNGSLADFTPLTPRQPLAPSPYALYAPTAGAAAVAATASAVAPGSIGAGALQPGAVDSTSIANGTITTADLSSALVSNTFWRLDGNIGTTPGLQSLGTLDYAALEFKVANARALRLEPGTNGTVNVIGGHWGNLTGTNMGATIGGGGNLTSPNSAQANFATVSGGRANQIGEGAEGATVSGGAQNSIQTNAIYSTIAGGQNNHIQGDQLRPAKWSFIGGGANHLIEPYAWWSVIGGGLTNRVQYDADATVLAGGSFNLIGTNADVSVIGGGYGNVVSNGAQFATIPGGRSNLIGTNAGYSVIGGGYGNVVSDSAQYAIIPGGRENAVGASYGFAAGRLANAAHPGTFVWADSQGTPFTSTAENQFLIRATGGVGIGTNSPHHRLRISGGPIWTANQWLGAIELDNAAALGWNANAGGQCFGIGQSGGGLYFFRTTSNPGTATNGANYDMIINDAGRVGIGTTAPTFQLQLSTDSAGKPNGGSWANSSDARIKKNIHPLRGALDKLTQLRGVSFEWINPADHANQTGRQAGFVAQEVERVFPNWVQEVPGAAHDTSLTPDGRVKSLSLPFEFDALTVEALRELRAENADLKKSLAELKDLVSQLAAQQNGGAR